MLWTARWPIFLNCLLEQFNEFFPHKNYTKVYIKYHCYWVLRLTKKLIWWRTSEWSSDNNEKQQLFAIKEIIFSSKFCAKSFDSGEMKLNFFDYRNMWMKLYFFYGHWIKNIYVYIFLVNSIDGSLRRFTIMSRTIFCIHKPIIKASLNFLFMVQPYFWIRK